MARLAFLCVCLLSGRHKITPDAAIKKKLDKIYSLILYVSTLNFFLNRIYVATCVSQRSFEHPHTTLLHLKSESIAYATSLFSDGIMCSYIYFFYTNRCNYI